MMEVDAHLINSDEYRLLETYCKKKTPTLRATEYMLVGQSAQPGDTFGDVAEKLTQISESFDGIETDSGPNITVKTEEDKVISQLVQLLKESGDNLNMKIQNNHELMGYLQRTFSYNTFNKLTEAFIESVFPSNMQRGKCEREKIALTLEVTSRLKTLDLQPMNRVMGYGTQYLQLQFTPWVKQHGGWEKLFDHGHDEEVH